MVNSTETTDGRTIVSGTPLPQNSHQDYTPDSLVSMLFTLLTHPEFQQGLMNGYEEFERNYEPAPFTEEEMIEEVEMNVSRTITERCKKLSQFEGLEPPSYLCNLGWVIGTIAKGLSYQETPQMVEC